MNDPIGLEYSVGLRRWHPQGLGRATATQLGSLPSILIDTQLALVTLLRSRLFKTAPFASFVYLNILFRRSRSHRGT